ncbi:prolipoprotein diacylglyceryl transferase [Acidiluteibacter ferrifornacis]|uniref:Diacylglyceryl transferase n=1 Tax=Acidiluteibacter ferrifornacis TaxID=2692424 RepID=A0A6N9NLT2_9FLAO|nr:prolipoprotein diacylglyceryl transferase family protein [Acidiluteibacter ferrifornacis]NBG66819.1 diacylglyceryl transferase [Acidiluteibacter ferrifornacis]
MYPTISDALKDLFGINIPLPLPSFGFFVAISFLLAAYFFTLELKRKEKNGLLKPTWKTVTIGAPASFQDLLLNGLFGFALGFKLPILILEYSQFVANPPSYILSGKGYFIGGVIGAAIAVYLRKKDADKQKLATPKTEQQKMQPHEHVSNMTLIAAVAGILGAKLFHNLENLDELLADPIGALTSFSGLSIYGGLIIGGGSVLYYAVKNGMTWIHVADACAPGLMAAYGMGRVGCQVAGDGDWGMPNDAPQPEWMSFLPDWTWAYDYPNNVLGIDIKEDFAQMGLESITGKAWPTPFYETIMAFIIFGILWSLRKRIDIPGIIFSIYLSLNGIERFLIEQIRINPDYHFAGLSFTQAEMIAVILFLSGIAGMIYFTKNKNKYLPQT